MLNWASRFNICLFLDSHAYQMEPHAFECLLAVRGAEADGVIKGEEEDGAMKGGGKERGEGFVVQGAEGKGVIGQEEGREGFIVQQAGGGDMDRGAGKGTILQEAGGKGSAQDLPEPWQALEKFTKENNEDWLFGHLGYGAGRPVSAHPDLIGFPDFFFFVAEVVIELSQDRVRIGMKAEATGGKGGADEEAEEEQERGEERRVRGGQVEGAAGMAQGDRPGSDEAWEAVWEEIRGVGGAGPGMRVAERPMRDKNGAEERTGDAGRPGAGRGGEAEGTERAGVAGQREAVRSMGPLQARFTREEYIRTVERLRAHILRGDCYEINFCQEFFAEGVELDPVAAWLALGEASPTPFGAFYRLGDRYLLCASPERWLASRGGRLISQPIKGTSARDLRDAGQDALNKEHLYYSDKDRSENVMVVDLVRNDLSRVCVPGSVRVDELYGIYSFPQVHQMISTVSGEPLPGVSFVDCVRACFPMGSMTGAPKKRVMELIEQHERSRRGLFSGAVGYLLPGGDGGTGDAGVGGKGQALRGFDFNVVIRSVFYDRAGRRISWQVGSGITFNSDADQEYEECMLKAEGIRKALGIY